MPQAYPFFINLPNSFYGLWKRKKFFYFDLQFYGIIDVEKLDTFS